MARDAIDSGSKKAVRDWAIVTIGFVMACGLSTGVASARVRSGHSARGVLSRAQIGVAVGAPVIRASGGTFRSILVGSDAGAAALPSHWSACAWAARSASVFGGARIGVAPWPTAARALKYYKAKLHDRPPCRRVTGFEAAACFFPPASGGAQADGSSLYVVEGKIAIGIDVFATHVGSSLTPTTTAAAWLTVLKTLTKVAFSHVPH